MINLRILAVDDEAGMLSGISRALVNFTVQVPDAGEEVCFEMFTAGTGEAAVELMQKNPPDIVLLDYKLPGMSGIDVLNRVAQLFPDTLTVMVTAYASIETVIAATKRGAYDFLAKPFTPADLRYIVRKATLHILLARHARKLEAERRRVRFEFIRVLGHELKAPINAVAGYLYLLRDHTLGDSVSTYDDAIVRSLHRIDQMRKLITDLLDMTRLESGEKVRKLEQVELVEVAKNAIDAVRIETDSRNIAVVLNSPASVQIAQADRSEMDMVFNNLLTNAVKYNKDNGRVTIDIKSCDGEIVVSVADTGIGMTTDETSKLFHEFMRIKNAKTRDVLGSGLGLSILKRIVELYKGRIDVKSKPDRGTTFRITLKTHTGQN